jgi:hypothetical protein
MHHKGAKQHNRTLVLAKEPNIMVNSTSMSWQCVYLLLKSYIVDVDDQVIALSPYRVMLAMVLSMHAGNSTAITTWP